MVQELELFKDTSYLELWQPLCSVEQNHLCKFSRRHHEKQFCEIILNFDQWFKKEMSFKDTSYLELWQPFNSAEWNHLCNFGRRHHEEHFCEIILNLDKWFRRRVLLKIFLSVALAAFCSAEWNHLRNFGREYQEEQFCEIILNLDQWFWRRCCLKIFLIWSSGGPIVQQSRTICAILVEGIMRNNSVKLF